MANSRNDGIWRWLAGGACLVLAGACARHALFVMVERDAFEPKLARAARRPPLPDVPAAAVSDFSFASGDRILSGNCVTASPAAPAVLVFHGDDEDLDDWVSPQTLLYRHGISSCVFDYSGYGSSTGRPRISRLRQDALEAYRRFVAATPMASRRYVAGVSLGSGVLLDVAAELRPAPVALVIIAGFASARDAAVITGRVSPWLAWALPNPWDNERRLRDLRLPLLLVHSRADEVIPFSHAERLARAASGPHTLVALDRVPHDAAIVPQWETAVWSPIVAYVHTAGGDPAQPR
jgi:alpha-beta hydrolase superfamily lysophospholipase